MSLKMVCRDCESEICYDPFLKLLYCPKCKIYYETCCKDCNSKKLSSIYPVKKENIMRSKEEIIDIIKELHNQIIAFDGYSVEDEMSHNETNDIFEREIEILKWVLKEEF